MKVDLITLHIKWGLFSNLDLPVGDQSRCIVSNLTISERQILIEYSVLSKSVTLLMILVIYLLEQTNLRLKTWDALYMSVGH